MSHPIENPCPKCAADVGQPCMNSRGGDRRAFHRERGSRRKLAAVAEHGHRVDSPIEDALVGILNAWIDHHGAMHVFITTQVPIGPYRADMLVTVECRDGPRHLVVEADGARFHNTPEAIAHDKRRDRYFTIRGFPVMRFTGAEIQRDPRGCAAEIGLWIGAQR